MTCRAVREVPARIARRLAPAAAIAAVLLTPAAAQRAPSAEPSPYARAIAAGYKALTICSAHFNARRSVAQIEADELRGIYPDYAAITPGLTATVRDEGYTGMVTVPFGPDLPPRAATWSWADGCTIAPIGATPALVTVQYRRPPPALAARFNPDPRPWPLGDADIAPRPSPALAAAVDRAFDRAGYGQTSETVGVVVLRDGRVVAERYRDGFGPFTANRTWSVAKSITGTLAGLARLDPARPAPVPEWRAAGDPRGAITTDQLLRMASGLRSATAGNRTDAIYFGGTAVTEEATGWPLEARPGTRFRYANNDTLLAVRAMRAHLGEARYRDFPRAALFEPLGMRHSIAEADWRGNYILSSQVWSTARDLARLGQFWLQDGVWQGKRLLPEGWVKYMATPSGPQPPGDGPGYGATLWLFGPKQGLPAGSFAAQGNRGQFVMVVPSERLVVVRRGEDPGAARFDNARFTADVIAAGR
jgi:CubicO group peptidase (beta-lactamase class C family)